MGRISTFDVTLFSTCNCIIPKTLMRLTQCDFFISATFNIYKLAMTFKECNHSYDNFAAEVRLTQAFFRILFANHKPIPNIKRSWRVLPSATSQRYHLRYSVTSKVVNRVQLALTLCMSVHHV